MTLWHRRFDATPASELMDFTASISFDKTLASQDLQCSRAHCDGLVRAGIISDEDYRAIVDALDQVTLELQLTSDPDQKANKLQPTSDAQPHLSQPSFIFHDEDEDIHSAIERRVTELAGDAGAKLHTGRSRNDQVATDLRLWLKTHIEQITGQLLQLIEVICNKAQWALDNEVYMPGYTHVQHAQPISVAHYFLAHGWALLRDVDRLHDSYKRVDVSPLGAGALAGSSLPLDPHFTAERLGFANVFENSLDAVSDRDFVAETLFTLAMLGVHLSRMGEEFVLWSSSEFDYVSFDDQFTTGSSMLPQKKNADIAELARGKSGRLIGNLVTVLTVLKGLPFAYNRDLQEDKEAIFDSVKQIERALPALTMMLDSATFNVSRMKTMADSPFASATDLAEHLVVQGVPFREAHAIVGSLVKSALEAELGENHKGQSDANYSVAEARFIQLVIAHKLLGHDAAKFLEPGASVIRRTTHGGAAPAQVAKQLVRLRSLLDLHASNIGKHR